MKRSDLPASESRDDAAWMAKPKKLSLYLSLDEYDQLDGFERECELARRGDMKGAVSHSEMMRGLLTLLAEDPTFAAEFAERVTAGEWWLPRGGPARD